MLRVAAFGPVICNCPTADISLDGGSVDSCDPKYGARSVDGGRGEGRKSRLPGRVGDHGSGGVRFYSHEPIRRDGVISEILGAGGRRQSVIDGHGQRPTAVCVWPGRSECDHSRCGRGRADSRDATIKEDIGAGAARAERKAAERGCRKGRISSVESNDVVPRQTGRGRKRRSFAAGSYPPR